MASIKRNRHILLNLHNEPTKLLTNPGQTRVAYHQYADWGGNVIITPLHHRVPLSLYPTVHHASDLKSSLEKSASPQLRQNFDCSRHLRNALCGMAPRRSQTDGRNKKPATKRVLNVLKTVAQAMKNKCTQTAKGYVSTFLEEVSETLVEVARRRIITAHDVSESTVKLTYMIRFGVQVAVD